MTKQRQQNCNLCLDAGQQWMHNEECIAKQTEKEKRVRREALVVYSDIDFFYESDLHTFEGKMH